MKRSHVFIPLIVMMISLASMTASGNELYGKHTLTVVRHQTVIRKGPVLVKKIAKPKLFSGKPVHSPIGAEDWDDTFDTDDIITPYRRKDLTKIEHEDGISDRVRWRLFLARQLALLKHKEVHG